MLTLTQKFAQFKIFLEKHCATCRSVLESKTSLLELM